jgi:hypothetical protein
MKKLTLQVVSGFVLFFGAVGAFLTMQYGGDLMRDIALRGQAMEVHPTARVRNADCTRYYFLMSACKIEYENRPAGRPVTNIQTLRSTSFLVFGSLAGERILLLHPRARPDLITTNASMAYVGNRVAALLTLLGFCLVISVGLVARYMREKRVAEASDTETVSSSGRAMEDAMNRHLQAQGLVRTPTVTGGPSGSGTFGRRGG